MGQTCLAGLFLQVRLTGLVTLVAASHCNRVFAGRRRNDGGGGWRQGQTGVVVVAKRMEKKGKRGSGISGRHSYYRTGLAHGGRIGGSWWDAAAW